MVMDPLLEATKMGNRYDRMLLLNDNTGLHIAKR